LVATSIIGAGLIICFSENVSTALGIDASAPRYRSLENVGVHSVVVAELKFRDVQQQILFADFVKRTHHAALEDRPETLNRIGVDRAHNILAHMATGTVIDGLMRETMLPMQPMIAGIIIGAEQTYVAGNCLLDEAFECTDANIVNDAGDDITLPLYCSNDRDLAASAASVNMGSLVPMTVGILAADIGFIDFYDAAQFGFGFDQSGADFMAHGMCGAVATETHDTLDLQGADSFLAGQHQMHDAKPVPEWLVCVLEDRPGNVRETIGSHGSALVALPMERFPGQRERISAAARAFDAIRPTAGDQISLAGFLVGERRFELRDRHLMHWFRTSRAGHGSIPVYERNISWLI